VDFCWRNRPDARSVHITFFGGETLMNFPLLKQVVAYANEQAAEQGRSIDFSLTTNATLLTPAIIEFLSENRIGVTVSMDGPRRCTTSCASSPTARAATTSSSRGAGADRRAPHAAHHGARHAHQRRDRRGRIFRH
jgi:MoaA/NifB/PqqE/SkfB family radical SAM enzyme